VHPGLKQLAEAIAEIVAAEWIAEHDENQKKKNSKPQHTPNKLRKRKISI